MNMNQKGFVNIILIAVVIILAGVMGYYIFTQKFGYPNTLYPSSNTQQTPPTKDKTADWRIYTNNKYGFQISYPPDVYTLRGDQNANELILFKTTDIKLERPSPSMWVVISSNSQRLSVDDYIREEFKKIVIHPEDLIDRKISFNNIDARVLKNVGFPESIIFTKGELGFMIAGDPELLKTFKFVK